RRVQDVRRHARDEQGPPRQRRSAGRRRAARLRAERTPPRPRGEGPRGLEHGRRAGAPGEPGRSLVVGRPRVRRRALLQGGGEGAGGGIVDFTSAQNIKVFGTLDARQQAQFAADFDASILRDAPPISPALRKAFADTAAWMPHVVTDAKGEATVKVKLPDNL